MYFRDIHFILGNINEDLAFEYDDGTETQNGCGATLQNEFWYFGGANHNRQVSISNSKIILGSFLLRSAKLSAVNLSDKPIWLSISLQDHAIHSLKRTQKCFSALMKTILRNATRKFFPITQY